MDTLEPWLSELTPVGALLLVVFLVVRAIVTGRLIPEASHDRIVKTYAERAAADARIAERQAVQLDKLTDQGETVVHLLESIRAEASRPNRPNRPNDRRPT